MKMKKAVKEILVFELFYKLLFLCLVNPLMNEIYQTYVSSKGVAFNKNIITTFVSIKGILIFCVLILMALVLIFYEYSVMINIIALCRGEKEFHMRDVLQCSIWNLKALKGKGMVLSVIYFVFLLPLVKVGYFNSIVPDVSVPWFIYGEMQRTEIGRAGMWAIYLFYFGVYLFMILVPVYMVLKQETIGRAAKSTISFWHNKKIAWKWKLMPYAAFILWGIAETAKAWYWRRNMLEYKDFDIYFLKYMIYSAAFRKDFLYWILLVIARTIGMILFLYAMVIVFSKGDEVKINLHPDRKGDAGVIFRICKKHAIRFVMGCREKSNRKRVCVIGCFFLIGIGWYGYLSLRQTPLVHRPWVIGHRGCYEGIENTIEALEAADEMNVDYAEIDVQLSKDGVPVVVHDSNLWRLAKKAVNVSDLTLEELKSLDISTETSEYEGITSKIPTLEEAIQVAKSSNNHMGLLIELKSGGRLAETLADEVIRLVEEYEFGEKAIFMSLYYECIEPVQKKHPEWWVGYCIFGSSGEIDNTIWQYDIDFLAPEENQVSNRLVTQAREHSLPVYVWTVADTEKMKQYLEMGVTGLISDTPDDVWDVVDAYNEKNGMNQYSWKKGGYPTGEQWEN